MRRLCLGGKLIAAVAAWAAAACPAQPVRLAYRFESGEVLRYTVERQDSLWAGEPRGAFFRYEQSLACRKQDRSGRAVVALSADAPWQGADNGGPLNRYEKMLAGTDWSAGETTWSVRPTGRAADRPGRFTPLLIPLPEGPVSPDQSWPVEIEVPYDEPFDGKLRILGTAQLFDVTAEGPDSIAVLALQLEKHNRASISVHEPFQTLTDRYDTREIGAGVVHFDMKRGRVVRAVLHWNGSVNAVEGNRNVAYRKKSRMSFRLNPDAVPEPEGR